MMAVAIVGAAVAVYLLTRSGSAMISRSSSGDGNAEVRARQNEIEERAAAEQPYATFVGRESVSTASGAKR